jgi:hypothetical protein
MKEFLFSSYYVCSGRKSSGATSDVRETQSSWAEAAE